MSILFEERFSGSMLNFGGVFDAWEYPIGKAIFNMKSGMLWHVFRNDSLWHECL